MAYRARHPDDGVDRHGQRREPDIRFKPQPLDLRLCQVVRPYTAITGQTRARWGDPMRLF